MEKKQKVVILEDDLALAKSLSTALGRESYEVFSAVDGETGLRTIEEKKPDLVILDIVLPRKSGFEVMEEISSRDDLKNIPVMVLTNLESSEDVNRMLELGVKSFLVKTNYSLEEVVAKIKEILNEA